MLNIGRWYIIKYDIFENQICTNNIEIIQWLKHHFKISKNHFRIPRILMMISKDKDLDTIKWLYTTFKLRRKDFLKDGLLADYVVYDSINILKWLHETFGLSKEVFQDRLHYILPDDLSEFPNVWNWMETELNMSKKLFVADKIERRTGII